jgi:hypothetical protein
MTREEIVKPEGKKLDSVEFLISSPGHYFILCFERSGNLSVGSWEVYFLF